MSRLFDTFCIFSILGIWPRFIEPRILKKTALDIDFPIKNSFKILQISDLHFNSQLKESFLNKLVQTADMIVITGDFLCNAALFEEEKMKRFLMRLKAPFGVFAVLGNHDYNAPLNVNEKGDYDAIYKKTPIILSALKRLWCGVKASGNITKRAQSVKPHEGLLQLLKDASVTLLHNQTVQINGLFNLTGLGELMAGDADPDSAFQNYDPSLPGVVLAHNPDSIAKLSGFPGSFVLSGHTHGGEINIPWVWRRFAAMENKDFKSGLYPIDGKQLYISRGVGGVVPFRFNAPPEVVLFTLKRLL